MVGQLRFLQSVFVLAAFGLCGRLAYLQIWEAPGLAGMAQMQRTKTVDLAALRREIVDRNGRELAVSVAAWSVYAQPADFDREPYDIAVKLAPVLATGVSSLTKELSAHHWTWLARQLSPSQAKRITAIALPGIGLVKETKRLYPKGELAASLIGFVGADNQGLAGIEHDFDKLLRGPPRSLTIQVDAKGQEILREASESPLDTLLTDGARVSLTLDEAIQHEAQWLLGQAIENYQAEGGTVLVLDPRSGDVLAFATLPTYDPNFHERVPLGRTTNSAVSAVFEPGSIMKPFTVAAALETGAVTEQSAFDCPPRIAIGSRTIGDHDPPPGVRHLSVSQIIQVSSNVGTAQIGLRMEDQVQRQFLGLFGYGHSTGSGLGGESNGLLPKLPWKPINHATISYGQGVSVTALQLAVAECVLANGGFKVRPRLVREVVSADGRVIQDFPPPAGQRILKPPVVAAVGRMLQGVTAVGGTGTAARIPGYQVAGKTGTAQKVRSDGRGYSSNVVASFLGYVPANNPRIVVLASLDSPHRFHFAAQTAAPLFRDVAAATLRILGVEPDPTLDTPPETSHAAD